MPPLFDFAAGSHTCLFSLLFSVTQASQPHGTSLSVPYGKSCAVACDMAGNYALSYGVTALDPSAITCNVPAGPGGVGAFGSTSALASQCQVLLYVFWCR